MTDGPPGRDDIDFAQIPRDPWGEREYMLGKVLPAILHANRAYLQTQYPKEGELRAVRDFVHHDMLDAARGDWGALSKVWFFPWLEAAGELDLALTQIMAGFYRASFDHQRRALELVVVGALFVADATPRDVAQRWIASQALTPMFSRALDDLTKHEFVREFDDRTQWAEAVKEHYWSLCDVVHVRGTNFALGRVQPMRSNYNGMRLPEFNAGACGRALDALIVTTEHVAACLALANPVLLFGLPMDEKFGLNGPISGFFQDGQADRLRGLLREAYRTAIVELADADEGVRSVRNWVESMPDLPEEEWQRQVDEQNKLFNREDQALPNLKFRQGVAVGKALRGSVPLIFEAPHLTETGELVPAAEGPA